MFLDASVILAVLLGEPERAAIEEALENAASLSTSPLALFEVAARLTSKFEIDFMQAQQFVDEFLAALDISVLPLSDETRREAVACAQKYHHLTGHPAKLNLGDCFAYAAARQAGMRLAYKGNDFSYTDIPAVKFG